jgi:hypothetical protein
MHGFSALKRWPGRSEPVGLQVYMRCRRRRHSIRTRRWRPDSWRERAELKAQHRRKPRCYPPSPCPGDGKRLPARRIPSYSRGTPPRRFAAPALLLHFFAQLLDALASSKRRSPRPVTRNMVALRFVARPAYCDGVTTGSTYQCDRTCHPAVPPRRPPPIYPSRTARFSRRRILTFCVASLRREDDLIGDVILVTTPVQERSARHLLAS